MHSESLGGEDVDDCDDDDLDRMSCSPDSKAPRVAADDVEIIDDDEDWADGGTGAESTIENP